MSDFFKNSAHAIRKQWRIQYLLLAIPGVFLPIDSGMCMHGHHFALGFPALGWLTVGDEYDLSYFINFISDNIIPLGILFVFWTVLIYCTSILRKWASQRTNFIGPSINALTISLYAFLCFFFLIGWTHVLWEACLQQMDNIHLEKAYIWTSNVFPGACFIAACLPLTMIFKDSFAWKGFLRIPYIISGLLGIILFAYLARAVPFEIKYFEDMAQIHRTNIIKQESANDSSQGTSHPTRYP